MTNHKTKELSFSSTIILVYQYPAWIRAKLLEQLKRNIIPPKIIWAKVYQEIHIFTNHKQGNNNHPTTKLQSCSTHMCKVFTLVPSINSE